MNFERIRGKPRIRFNNDFCLTSSFPYNLMDDKDQNIQRYEQWLTELGLNSEDQNNLKRQIYLYIYNRRYFILLLIVLLLPILIYYIVNYIDINYHLFDRYNFSKDNCISFLGSYLGGIATFIGVVMTICYSYRLQNIHEEKNKLQKECDSLIHFVKLNNISQFCNKKFTEFSACIASEHEDERIQEILKDIYIYNNEIQFAMTDLTITSNIFSMNKNCTNCKYKCNLYKIKKEFIHIINEYTSKNYYLINDMIYIMTIKLNSIKKHSLLLNNNISITEDELKREIDNVKHNFDIYSSKYSELDDHIQKAIELYSIDYTPKMNILIKYYIQECNKSICSSLLHKNIF